MKKFLLITLSIVIIIVSLCLVLAYKANSIVTHFKPTIENQLSQIINDKVSIEQISLSIFPTTILKLDQVQIGETKRISSNLSGIELKLDLIKLLKGSLELSNLTLNSPTITVVKSEGSYKISGLSNSAKKPATKSPDQAKIKPQTKNEKPIKINLEDLSINNATINLQDQNKDLRNLVNNLNLRSKLKISTNQITLEQIKLDAEIEKTADLRATGNCSLINSQPELNLNLFLSKFNPNYLLETLSIANPTQIKETTDIELDLSGKLSQLQALIKLKESSQKILINNFEFSKISSILNLSKNQNDLQIKTSNLKLKLNDAEINSKLEVDFGNNLKISKSTIELFSGSISPDLILNNSSKKFELKLQASNLELDQAIEAILRKKDLFTGRLSKLNLNLNGYFNQQLKESLNGVISLKIENGLLKNTNIAASVLNSLNSLEFIKLDLASNLPQDLRNEINSPDSKFDSISGSFDLATANLHTNDFLISSPLFQLSAAGQISLDSDLNLQSKISFNPKLSKHLVSKVKELENFLDQRQQLELPLIIKGTITQPKVLPDSEMIINTAGRKIFEKKAGKALDKLLGGKVKNIFKF